MTPNRKNMLFYDPFSAMTPLSFTLWILAIIWSWGTYVYHLTQLTQHSWSWYYKHNIPSTREEKKAYRKSYQENAKTKELQKKTWKSAMMGLIVIIGGFLVHFSVFLISRLLSS